MDTEVTNTPVDPNQTELPLPAVPGIVAPPAETPPKAATVQREKKAPKVKGLTIGGMKKKVSIRKGKPESAAELRERLNDLLTALVTVVHANKKRWTDLKNADNSKAAAKLETLIKRERFYKWQTVGEAHYLVTGHLVGEECRAVAYIVQEGRQFKWTLENSRGTNGKETTLAKAKQVVELYRENFPA